MSKVIEDLKKEFLDDFFHEKEYISNEEYQKLLEASNKDIGFETENFETKYYKKAYHDYTKEELQEYTYMKTLEFNNRILNNLRMMNEKQEKMKNILTFWFILTIINICCVIYMAVKIAGVFNSL